MEVHLTPENEAQLQQLALRTGKAPAQVVEDAIVQLLEEDSQFATAVRDGFSAIDRGEFLEEEEMDSRIQQMLRP